MLRGEGEYLNGKKNGKWISYKDDGITLSGEKEYLNGKYNGKYKTYYYNGNLSDEGEYINGKRKGKWKFYYRNGNLKREIEFVYDSDDSERYWSDRVLWQLFLQIRVLIRGI